MLVIDKFQKYYIFQPIYNYLEGSITKIELVRFCMSGSIFFIMFEIYLRLANNTLMTQLLLLAVDLFLMSAMYINIKMFTQEQPISIYLRMIYTITTVEQILKLIFISHTFLNIISDMELFCLWAAVYFAVCDPPKPRKKSKKLQSISLSKSWAVIN